MPTSEGDLRARLRDIERHLAEMPPHNASGARDDLQRQRDELQRRLAAGGDRRPAPTTSAPTTSAPTTPGADVPDPRAGAVRSPADATPPPRPGSFLRTTHVAAGPADGGDYGDGIEVPRDLHGACRDVVVDGDGDARTLAEARVVGRLDVERRISSLELTPGPTPEALLGEAALPGLRGVVAGAIDDTTTARAAVLLDLGIGGNLAAYGRMQAGRRAGQTSRDVHRPRAIELLGDSCRGWALDGDMVASLRAGVDRKPVLPPAVHAPDEEHWHDLGELPPWWVRRRRRIQVAARDDGRPGRRVTSAFRDSWVDPDGIQRVLHEWELVLDLDGDDLVEDARAEARSLPFNDCALVSDAVPDLRGTPIAELRRRTRDVLGGPIGCTHLNDLLSTIPSAVVTADLTQDH